MQKTTAKREWKIHDARGRWRVEMKEKAAAEHKHTAASLAW